MKFHALAVTALLSMSTIASGASLWKKVRKACAKGQIEKLEKYKRQGYDPARMVARPTDTARSTHMSSFLNYAVYNNAYSLGASFEKTTKCFDWFYQNDALIDVNTKVEIPGFITVYDAGLLANEIQYMDIGDKKREKEILDWYEFLIKNYNYETQNLYMTSLGEPTCDLALAVGEEFSLSGIKRMVELGLKSDGACLSEATGLAEGRGYTSIANYLKSL